MTGGMAHWRSRIVGHGDVGPDDVVFNPDNWRIHPRTQADALEGVLGEVGIVGEVLVNQRTGHVIDGHLRLARAFARGQRWPATFVDLSPDEERVVLATLHPIADLAVTDFAKFAELSDGLDVSDEALAGLMREVREAGEMQAAGRADGTGAPGERPGERDEDRYGGGDGLGSGVIRLRVSAAVRARFETLMANIDGADDGERFGRLLQCVDEGCLA